MKYPPSIIPDYAYNDPGPFPIPKWYIEHKKYSVNKLQKEKDYYLLRRIRDIFISRSIDIVWADSASANSYIWLTPVYTSTNSFKSVDLMIIVDRHGPINRMVRIDNDYNLNDSLFSEYVVHVLFRPRKPFTQHIVQKEQKISDTAKFRLSWEKKLKESYLMKSRGHVIGQVLEKKTKEPIFGARVRLLLPDGTSAKMGSISDEKGNFIVLNVPSGIYQVEISYGATYERHYIKNVSIKENSIVTLKPTYLVEKSVERDTVFIRHSSQTL